MYFGVEQTVITSDGEKQQMHFYTEIEELLECNKGIESMYVCSENNACEIVNISQFLNQKNETATS